MLDVNEVLATQRELVERWHHERVENSGRELMFLVCEQPISSTFCSGIMKKTKPGKSGSTIRKSLP